MYTERDEQNAWLALKASANRLVRELAAATETATVHQENITTLELIRAERSKLSLPDKLMRRGMYSEQESAK